MKKARYYLSYLESFLLDGSREPTDDQLDKLDSLWNELSDNEVDFCRNFVADFISGHYTAEQVREIIQSL